MNSDEYIDDFSQEDCSQLQQEIAQPQTLEEVIGFYNYTVDEPIEATRSIEKAICEIKAIKQSIDVMQSRHKELKTKIALFMKDRNTLITEDGEVLATFKHSKPSNKFNEKAFKYDNPTLYEEFLVEKDPVRTMLIK